MNYFSIVMPLFNKEYSIIAAIESVVNQDFKNWELIIVNDGSTDRSLSEVHKYLAKNSFENIKVISQKNSGVSAARNKGVSVAKYDYICFLDSDDEWKFDFLTNIRSLIYLYNDAVLFSVQHESFINNKIVVRNKSLYKDGYRGYVDNFFKASIFGSIVNSSKTCLKKEYFWDIGGFPEGYKSGEDLFVWIELAMKGKVAFHNKVCSRINIVADNSRSGRGVSIPYPFIFYSVENNKKRLSFWSKLYLRKIYLAHIKESLTTKDYNSAKIRAKSGKVLFPVLSRFFLFFYWLLAHTRG